MTALVTNHLPLVAGAPDGIKKLRALILDLAVRGRLVQQDPNETSAADLLSKTAQVREQRNRGRRDSKIVLLDTTAISEDSFPLPEGWARASLSFLALKLTDGSHNPPRDAGSGIPMLSSQNVLDGHVDFMRPSRFVSREDFEGENARTDIAPGDVLLTIVASIGRSAVVPEDAPKFVLQRSVAVIQTLLAPRFLSFLLRSPLSLAYFNKHAKGTAQKGIYLGKLGGYVIYVPPLAEQHRIVAKVDELMALCDRLEADQADAEAAHAQLVQALLDSLTQATDAADFRASWQRLSEHFHTLFTTEASIDALKQTVLQLAVMGKLVPQLATDLPARDLLKRNKISSNDHPHLVGWAVTELSSLGSVLGGATPSKANASYWIGDIPWVSPKDMKRPLIDDAEDHVSSVALEESSLKAIPPKSILMVVRGMILAHSFPVAVTARTVTINQDMKALVPPPEIADYLLLFLQASKPEMVALVDRSSHGTCKLISEKLWSFKVSLPPPGEQHRIVAKVDELMALCNQLKAQLAGARQQHAQLATALVEQAVA